MSAISWFKEMLSSSNATSCMRFCVVVVVLTIMFNYTILNIIGFFCSGTSANLSIQEIIALLGMLGMKLGQKAVEKSNGGQS
ncbi:unnamed protein product [marine sediment metagenome]|uniref:Uncharacterized protein n=1 Tax=marine sediment metagenome TaxID=412755 RepID=X0U2P3_9ZZZZ